MIRLRSTNEAPPKGWVVGPPLVSEPVKEWSFSAACKHVKDEHPDWTPEAIARHVERATAERLIAAGLGERYVIVDSQPDLIPDLIQVGKDLAKQFSANKGLLLVMPFCTREIPLVVKLLDWMVELDPNSKPDILISYDQGTNRSQLRRVKPMVIRASGYWSEFCYPVEPRGYFAPNWAFQRTAAFIAGMVNRPWLWFEPDMTPLKPGWFQTLEQEYWRAKKACMGVLVPGMGHMNGTAIYPSNYAEWAKNAMKCTQAAWDMEQAKDLTGMIHEASSLMQHVWGIVNGQPHPSTGEAPSFKTRDDLRWVKPTAVTWHRCKDGTLIDRLREVKHAS